MNENCDHDYEPLENSTITKMMIMSEMGVSGCEELTARFKDTPMDLALQICLKCQYIHDQKEEFKAAVNKAIDELRLLSTWAPLRKKRAKEIYMSVRQMEQYSGKGD